MVKYLPDQKADGSRHRFLNHKRLSVIFADHNDGREAQCRPCICWCTFLSPKIEERRPTPTSTLGVGVIGNLAALPDTKKLSRVYLTLNFG
ncbi:hypothetical protein Agabi119p4_8529 [Agaricus bisporus var. burnettii]|uniref:Uncharacterized protein n=1 Tax=Agaricus bisporus var. burnettii TaxID=192524 RepID=A0A8H7EYG8_AGABI|nr:hypothetical protein Agabi119p4_8529 [Agaricus bisporus var. burnettii]